MSLLLNQDNLSEVLNFQRRVKSSIVHTAIAVASEDPATASHAARLVFAQKVLNNPTGYSQLMAIAVADNTTVVADFDVSGNLIVTESTASNDINFQVAAIWNAYI